MKPDELWDKYSDEEDVDGFPCEIMCKKYFLAALTEYGEHVKAEAVKVCIQRGENGVSKWSETELEESKKSDAWECLQCAAAIENMEIK